VKRFVTFQFLNPKTVGRTPWTGNQPDARPLPTQDNTNTECRQDIHVLSGIRAQDPSVPAGEDISYLRPRGHCNRPKLVQRVIKQYIAEVLYILHYIDSKLSSRITLYSADIFVKCNIR
jgi:hypothetical protein